MDKTTVLDRVRGHQEHVDFVACNNCGRYFLVDIGEEKCPECEEETLRWAEEETQVQEVNYHTFSQDYKDDYLLCDVEM